MNDIITYHPPPDESFIVWHGVYVLWLTAITGQVSGPINLEILLPSVYTTVIMWRPKRNVKTINNMIYGNPINAPLTKSHVKTWTGRVISFCFYWYLYYLKWVMVHWVNKIKRKRRTRLIKRIQHQLVASLIRINYIIDQGKYGYMYLSSF